LYKRYLLDVYV